MNKKYIRKKLIYLKYKICTSNNNIYIDKQDFNNTINNFWNLNNKIVIEIV